MAEIVEYIPELKDVDAEIFHKNLNRELTQDEIKDNIEYELNKDADADTLKINCEKILTAHVNNIFYELIPETCSLIKIHNHPHSQTSHRSAQMSWDW